MGKKIFTYTEEQMHLMLKLEYNRGFKDGLASDALATNKKVSELIEQVIELKKA